MREHQSPSIDNKPCNRCPTCYRLTHSGNARYDSLGLFRWKPSPFLDWAHHTQDGLTHEAAKTARTPRGPSLAPHIGGPGPSTNFAVPPVARVPGVTRPVLMIRARPRACQLTAQCEQDRDL